MKLFRSLPLLLACLLISAPGRAELPPLSPEMRTEQSSHILIVKVLKVEKVGVESSDRYPKIVFAANVRVLDVLKGDGVKSGDELKCTYWKAGKRPHGWTGPGGQYVQLSENLVAKLYLVKGEQDYRLLNPNGWEETEGKH